MIKWDECIGLQFNYAVQMLNVCCFLVSIATVLNYKSSPSVAIFQMQIDFLLEIGNSATDDTSAVRRFFSSNSSASIVSHSFLLYRAHFCHQLARSSISISSTIKRRHSSKSVDLIRSDLLDLEIWHHLDEMVIQACRIS